MVRVCFLGGQPVEFTGLAGSITLDEVRWRVAQALGAPAENVELLDESGARLVDDVELTANPDMKIQAFVFGLPDAGEEANEDELTEERRVDPMLNGLSVTYDEMRDLLDDMGMTHEQLQDHWRSLESFVGNDGQVGDCTSDTWRLRAIDKIRQSNTSDAGGEQAQDPEPSFPLHEAVNIGDRDRVKSLLDDGVAVGDRDTDGETALHRAAYHGRQDFVKIILAAHADPNVADRKGRTPLRRAYDSTEIAEMLLSAGADPNAVDKNGDATLHRVAEGDHVEVAKVLLRASADPNLLSGDDLSAFHTAVIFGKADVTKFLLGARADIHAKGAGGNTAAHFAAYGGRDEVGRLLMEAGAEAHICNDEGETPLQHARTAGQEASPWLLELDDLGTRLD